MSASKAKLLRNLKEHTYCRIARSSTHGVGVIAIKDIPEGTDPFECVHRPKYDIITLTKVEAQQLHPNVRKMLKDFCGNKQGYDVPANGLNSMDISFFMNHSNTPTIQVVDDPNQEYLGFRAKRAIKTGEELTIDYRRYEG